MDDFAGFVARYGVAAVFLFTFLENAGLPIPAFPVLMLAGAYASTRHAYLPLIVGVGGFLTAGSSPLLLAAMIAYFALLSFVPLLFLALSLLGFAGRPSESTYFVTEFKKIAAVDFGFRDIKIKIARKQST